MSLKYRNQKGFTLVELLIVVIILGILAAVVIPQFNTAASESKESAMASNLATVRQAIEMYKVQHNDVFPGNTTGVSMENSLTQDTNLDGSLGSGSGLYGPYLRNAFPKNPLSGVNTVAVTTSGAIAAPTDQTGGWAYHSGTGEFRSFVSGAGPSGTDYFDL